MAFPCLFPHLENGDLGGAERDNTGLTQTAQVDLNFTM